MKLNHLYWKEGFSRLRKAVLQKGRIVTIEEVMAAEGYRSQASAHHALLQWEKMGLVVKGGGHWRLVK